MVNNADFAWLPTKRSCSCPDGKLNCLSRRQLNELSSTVIDVKVRERWKEKHSGRFISQVPAKFIALFSHTNESVLDPFCGSGTTNVEAKRAGRNSIGIDINPFSVEIANQRIAALECSSKTRHDVFQGDCVDVMSRIPPAAVDLVVTSPPYFDVIDYKDNHVAQLGNVHVYPEFLDKMELVFKKICSVLKPGGHLVVVTQDVYRKRVKCPLHADYIFICRAIGFESISTQVYMLNYSNSGRGIVWGYPKSYYPKNGHEFIVIFQKLRQSEN